MQIAVIGAGLMGHGIALTLAWTGHHVVVTDPEPQARAALPGRVAESLRLMGVESAGILPRITVVDASPKRFGKRRSCLRRHPRRWR